MASADAPTSAPAPGPRRMPPMWVVGVAVVGLALRLWMTTQPLGSLDGDMAILGLMAAEAQEGNLSIFHWGQPYGGAQETYLAAILGLFGGVSLLTLQLTTIILSACTTVFLWLAAREAVSERAATIAAALFWVWPGPFVWWSLKIGSNYWFASAAAMAFVWLLLRERERETTIRSALLIGGVLGLAWWANPQIIYIVVPILAYQFRFLWSRRRWIIYLSTGFALGAAPWIYYNLTSGVSSVRPFATDQVDQGPLQGVANLFTHYFPMITGVRVPFSEDWIAAPVLPLAMTVLAVTAAIVVARVRPLPRLPLIGMAFFLVLFPFTPTAQFIDQPRYAFWMSPWFVMLVGVVLAEVSKRRQWIAPVAVALATTLTTVQLGLMNQGASPLSKAPDVPAPASSADLIALLDDNGVTRAYGDYWLAYRVIFETDERILVAPHYTDRHPSYTAEVRRSPTPPPHVFVKASKTFDDFLRYCEEQTIGCEVKERGAYAMVTPSRHIDRREALLALYGVTPESP